MASTYDPTLAADRDWVRFLTGDIKVPNTVLSDEEIDAVIADAETGHTKWHAAYYCGKAILSQWSSAGAGIFEKQVGDLRIKYSGSGSGESSSESYLKYLDTLLAKGNWELTPTIRGSRSFGMMGLPASPSGS